ncbi:MAG: hypothetical protein ACK48R_03100, partial [Planctomyces sp.]
MRDGVFFPVFRQTAIQALLIMSVVCCGGTCLRAGDETTQVVDQRLVTELSACLSRGHGLKLRGHFEALAVRGRSVLGKLRALHDECPRDSAQRLSLAMACLVCGDVSNERLSELTIGVCSGDAERTEVTAVALQ